MNKAELLDAISGEAGVDKRQAESVLEAFFETIRTEAKGGNKVAWPGFGSFSTSERSARTGRNPQTGEPVKIAASTGMKFAPSSNLKEFLNSKGAKKSAAKKSAPAASKGTAPAKKAAAKKASR